MQQKQQLELTVLPQGDVTTCGPTCLEAVYRYYGQEVSIRRLIADVVSLRDGGTLAVWPACDALKRGFAAEIYTYNLHILDPSWFTGDVDLAQRLGRQKKSSATASCDSPRTVISNSCGTGASCCSGNSTRS